MDVSVNYVLAKYMEIGIVVSINQRLDEETISLIAEEFWFKIEIVSSESEKFDFAFIDADKINYLEYYKRIITLIKPGGIIVLDNMLWSGEVIEPKDDNSKALQKTAMFINDDKRVYNMLLPIRDGLMICYKK